MRELGRAETPLKHDVPFIPTARLTPGLCPSYTFQQVQEHTDKIWKFQRHDLIEEYHGRPPAPPPLILLNHLQLLLRRCLLRQPATHHKLSEDQSPSCPLPPPQGTAPALRHKAAHAGCVLGFGMPRDVTALPSSFFGRGEAGEKRRSCPSLLGDVPEGELPAAPAVPGEAEHRADDPGHCTEVRLLLRKEVPSVLQCPEHRRVGISAGVAAEGVPTCTVSPGLMSWQSCWTWTG